MYKFLLALFLCCCSSSLGFADSYSRGNYTCESFKDAEFSHKYDPDNIHIQMWYAKCLILKGDDAKGLAMLNHIVDRHNQVNAAYTLADHIKTGGKFRGLDEEKVDEAISASQRVLFLIDLDPHYPYNGNEIYEWDFQMELWSQYMVTLLYFKKFQFGALGTHNKYLAQSPSYEGDKSALDRYPQYESYTVDTLQKMQRFGNRCASLPKKPHFREEVHKEVTRACAIIRDAGKRLLPLEEKRLALLFRESCQKDLSKCSEYNDVFSGLGDVFIQSVKEINDTITNAERI